MPHKLGRIMPRELFSTVLGRSVFTFLDIDQIIYSFFQVVIPKSDLREEDSESPKISEYLETYYVQIAQLGVVLLMFISL